MGRSFRHTPRSALLTRPSGRLGETGVLIQASPLNPGTIRAAPPLSFTFALCSTGPGGHSWSSQLLSGEWRAPPGVSVQTRACCRQTKSDCLCSFFRNQPNSLSTWTPPERLSPGWRERKQLHPVNRGSRNTTQTERFPTRPRSPI